MKNLSALRNILLVLSLLGIPAVHARAQTAKNPPAPDPLFQTVAALDTALFDAYNRCDLEKLGSLVADDLEFYHDKTGLSVGKQRFLEDIQKYICGKVRRDLVPGTLEVYPINGYGAVEIGTHRFHHPGHDDTEQVGEAKFVTLWQNKGGDWRITRVISYDHVSLPK
ncbi:MAG TPA: nuclear transport factor 2 family protein [Terriglobales bacterium]|nr:nuclear transport factor 2 family protein [Terriglobales bacterium]